MNNQQREVMPSQTTAACGGKCVVPNPDVFQNTVSNKEKLLPHSSNLVTDYQQPG